VAVFGVMGEDLVQRHYWPTLVYGQNYLLSPTPYLYAFWRLLLPGAAPALALALAGSLFSIGGLALALAAFRRTQRSAGAGVFWPSLAVALLAAGNVTFIADHAKNSGVELSLFLIGLMLWAGSRIEARPRPADWLVLGAATGFADISRLQMIFYGLPLLGLLLIREWRREGFRPAAAGAALAALGMALGYAPLLAHRFWRAGDWPSAFELPLTLGTGEQIVRSWKVTLNDMLPGIFGIRPEMTLKPLRYLLWAVAVLPAYMWTLWKKPARTSMLDHALVLGSLAILAALILVPSLSRDGEQRRYALTLFIAGIWLCGRFWPAPGWRNAAAVALGAGLLAAAVPRWEARLEKSRLADQRLREARALLVPELASHGAVILANYWDASLLQFLSDGRLAVEALPWGAVRTYGRVPRSAFGRRTLWLALQGRERELTERLRGEAGAAAPVRIPLQNRFQGKSGELWEFPDRALGARLMERAHPLYFRTPYPPGSGPIRPVAIRPSSLAE
jgi:hypothetical protein